MTLSTEPYSSRSLPRTLTAGGSLSLAIGALVVVLDQITKHWATLTLNADPSSGPSILGGWLALVYTTNTGAAFGVLADRGILFFIIGIVVLGVVIAYWRFLPNHRPLLRISLGLQLGGATGNLIDRVRIGYVVDFIQVKDWPVFNVADSAIVCGVALLMYYLACGPSATSRRLLTH
ncbi:MAG TPA: signal peptidase II [Chloroflexota bacterium]|nr:signal peptidase II [Chloroflexota bacterium]